MRLTTSPLPSTMTRGWPLVLFALFLCFPRQASSFFAHPPLPRAARTTAARTSTVTIVAATAGSVARMSPPSYIAKNNVSLAGDFVASREGEPTDDELANDNLMRIVGQKGADEGVNWIVWKCLGYRYDPDNDAWKAANVFPKWKELYPEPVDLLGLTRTYQPEIDKPIKAAVQNLTKSVPHEYKKLIIEHLRPLGFTGFLYNELTPNRTRRALLTNFLIYYREHLRGVPLEEVERRRVEREAARAAEAARATEAAKGEEATKAEEA